LKNDKKLPLTPKGELREREMQRFEKDKRYKCC